MEKVISDIGILSEKEKNAEGFLISKNNNTGKKRKLYIESYGCQMNFSDSEIVASILEKEGYQTTRLMEEAEIVFIIPFLITHTTHIHPSESCVAGAVKQKN